MSRTGVKLSVSNLQKRWGTTQVLDNINFDIEAGTFLTLLGPSGCGKSTALRLIAGLNELSAGSILIDGRDVSKLQPADRNIGMVFQNYALFPHMNVRQNILYGMRFRREPAENQKRNLERMTELMGLDVLLDRFPGQLSGGQQQRVALARVLVAERPLVLMDEPLSIGTPPMNLFPASLVNLEIPGAQAIDTRDPLVGIRPEDLVLRQSAGATSLQGKVINTEFEGAQTLATIDVSGNV